MVSIRKYIQDKRVNYITPYPPEMKRGARFNSDNSVEKKLRMMYLEDAYPLNKLWQLPKIEQVPMDWIDKNINKCFDSLCEADWNFTNNDKWN